MKFKQFFLALCTLSLLFIACDKGGDVLIPQEDNPTFTLEMTVDGTNTLSFPFYECFDNDLQESRPSAGGTLPNGPTDYMRGLKTVMNSGGLSDATTLSVELEMRQSVSEGEIDAESMVSILESELNNLESEYLNLRLGLDINGLHYTNQPNFFQFPNYYYSDIVYNMDYTMLDSECLDHPAIKLEGEFEGFLRNYNQWGVADSVYVQIPDFEMLLLIH